MYLWNTTMQQSCKIFVADLLKIISTGAEHRNIKSDENKNIPIISLRADPVRIFYFFFPGDGG